MHEDLTQAVMAYQDSGEDWPELSARISLYAYQFPIKFTNWDHDRCGDFFVSFLPKIPGLVRRYKPNHPFATYLFSSLKWYMKTFTEHLAHQENHDVWSRKECSRELETLAENKPHQIGDFIPRVMEPSPECPFGIDETGRLANAALRHRVLAAAMVYAVDIESKRIPSIAKLTGVEPLWLEWALDLARETVRDKVERRDKLRMRRNECWYKMTRTRNRMHTDGLWDEEVYKEWRKKYLFWKKYHLLACGNLRRLSLKVAHEDVARILNIPVGTIASGLYTLRKYWNETGYSG